MGRVVGGRRCCVLFVVNACAPGARRGGVGWRAAQPAFTRTRWKAFQTQPLLAPDQVTQDQAAPIIKARMKVCVAGSEKSKNRSKASS